MTEPDTNPETEPNDMALTTKINNLFKSRDGALVDTVVGKLADARAAHDALLAQRPDAALADALGEEGAEERLATLMRDIAASDDKIALLVLALQEAERREAERKRQARLAADKSRVRALEQHLAKLRTAAAGYERATRDQLAAWNAMKDASRRAGKLLLNGDDRMAADQLSPASLASLCVQEMQRVAFVEHPATVGPYALPGVPAPHYFDADKRPPSLTDTLASHCEFALGQSEASGARIADRVPVEQPAELPADGKVVYAA